MKVWWIDNERFKEVPKKNFLPPSTALRDYPKRCAVVKIGKVGEGELCIYFIGLNSKLLVKVKPKRGKLKYSFSGELEGMSFSEVASAVELIQNKFFQEVETRADPYEFTLNAILKRKASNHGKAKA